VGNFWTMLKSLSIERFRCFENTSVNGFGLVNLISGKNNAGKTALLEAILLANKPSNSSIIDLYRVIRREDLNFLKELPSRAWDNFFFKQEKKDEIVLTSQTYSGSNQQVRLFADESVDEFLKFLDKEEDNDKDAMELQNVLSNRDLVKSALHIVASSDNKEIMSSILIASKNGITGRGLPSSPFKETFLIPAYIKLSNEGLATEFDKAKFEGHSAELLEAFKLIDSDIESVDTYKIGDAALYLKRKGERQMPISMFGDAINKVADFVLRIVNNKESVILIDEIENGIHYTNQEYLWTMLFKLAKRFNVQIFSTTHSREMTDSFVRAAQKIKDENASGFFELSRHFKTNRIIANRISIETLDYKIENNKPFRGE